MKTPEMIIVNEPALIPRKDNPHVEERDCSEKAAKIEPILKEAVLYLGTAHPSC